VREGLPDRRLVVMLVASLVAFGAVLARAAYLQAFESGKLGELATGQAERVVPVPALRGAILDRDGRVLATSTQAITIGASTHRIRDPGGVAAELAPLLHVDRAWLAGRLGDRRVEHVDLARQVDPSVVAQVRRLAIPALDYTAEAKRVYPEGSIGSQVVGFAGLDGNGLGGAELEFNRVLQAHPGEDLVLQDPTGRTLRTLRHRPGVAGRTVRLTLDAEIQAEVEQVVDAAQQRWHAAYATGIVLDPRSGAVLALASAPGVPAGGWPAARPEDLRIRAITDQYEPGSTFKVVTIGASIEEGKVTPQTVFTVPYTITRYGKTVEDAHWHPTEPMSVSQILAISSNVGAITIAKDVLGQTEFSRWIHRLGFGRRTGIDLPGEEPGYVLPLDQWSGTSIINMPIGIGVAVTPMQMASLYAAIADGGVWHEPHVLDRIAGERKPRVPTRRLLSRSTSSALVGMLQQVVLDGTGLQAQIPGYTVAGKTGTTQKVDPKTHTYCGGGVCEYDASFVGFVPAHHPRAVILVLVDSPQGDYYGGDVAAPAFREIGAKVLQVLGVRPDAPASPTTTAPAA
jgi:cell division protein FtsI/penicillin-binding protein 2